MKPPWLTDDEWFRYLAEFDISRPLSEQMAEAQSRAIEIGVPIDFALVSFADANALRKMVQS